MIYLKKYLYKFIKILIINLMSDEEILVSGARAK